MTNKEKLEIIDKKLNMLYENLSRNKWVTDYANDITQAIYNLESTKKLLESELTCSMCVGSEYETSVRAFNKDDPF